MLTPSATRQLLDRLGHHPNRRWGQNFLIDPNIVRKSTLLAGLLPGSAVVEIGPGLGALTAALLETGAEVYAVEIDPRLAGHLRQLWPVGQHPWAERFHLLEGDAVQHPLAGWPGASGGPGLHAPVKVVANLPYAISSPWLEAILAGPLPASLVLMTQKEAADRYAAEPGGKDFGAVSIFLQSAYARLPGHAVSRSCFFPSPDVDSVLLHLDRRPAPFVFPAPIRRLIRDCFTQRRKQIGALAKRWPGLGPLLAVLPDWNLDRQARPEQIPIPAWQRLASD